MNIIYGGDEAFSAIAFGEQHHNNQSFLSSFFTGELGQQGRQAFGDTFLRAKARFEAFNSEDAISLGKAALNQVRGYFVPNVFRYVQTLPDMQVCGLKMQRVIMSSPGIRQRYHEQRCDGFSETYIDVEPGRIGDDHSDYRQIMNGIVQVDDSGNASFTQYLDDVPEDDFRLDTTDQFNAVATMELAEYFMKQGFWDCTSAWNTKV